MTDNIPLHAEKYPILDFDPAPEAIIEPSRIIRRRDYSPRVVFCFFNEVIHDFVQRGLARQVDRLKSEMGDNPIYQVNGGQGTWMLVHPGVGAPLAAAFMDEMIARGCTQFIACGGCGVLDKSIPVGHLLVPVGALRDEGTSYAYQPPEWQAAPTEKALHAVHRTLQDHHAPYDDVVTWTTDAIYRETRALTSLRLKQGCRTVEMETSAFCAVAAFRGVEFAQILYGGDSVAESGWDARDWISRVDIRERMLWLAAEAVLGM